MRMCGVCGGTGFGFKVLGRDGVTNELITEKIECTACEGRGSLEPIFQAVFGEYKEEEYEEHA